MEAIVLEQIEKGHKEDAERILKTFWDEYSRRWEKAQRKVKRFNKENETWLEDFLVFEPPQSSESDSTNMGRPMKPFSELCERTKRLKTAELRATYSTEELVFAAQVSLRADGDLEAAEMLKNCTKVCIYVKYYLRLFSFLKQYASHCRDLYFFLFYV